MKFHALHFRFASDREIVMLLGFAAGRVPYRPQAKWLYSFRIFLLCFKAEILWTT